MTRPIHHVLLVTDAYPPEIRSASLLMRELAVGLRDRGYRVSVLTTFPRYNLTDEARRAFASVRANVLADEDGVRVLRVPTLPIHNVPPVVKGVGQLSLPVLLGAAGSLLPKVDAIIVYSPPLPLGLVAAALKVRFGARFILNVQDLFPQNAIDLGVLKDKSIIRAFEAIESFCYRAADRVTCHSEGNLAWLRRHAALRGRGDRVSVIHNWVDIDRYQATPPDPDVRARLGLAGKFVFFFGGVMGYAQDLDTTIRAARLLKDRTDVAFLLVGDGVERERLVGLAQGLPNVVFHPFIGEADYIGWLRAMDVGLVTLRAEMATPVVPSKLLGFMAAGVPYVALLNRQSDARSITTEGRCGIHLDPGNAEAAADAIAWFADNRAEAAAMGRHGLAYCRRHFSQDACIDNYAALLQSLSGPAREGA